MNESTYDFATPLRALLAEGGSDLHLKVGNRPLIRVDGALRYVDSEASVLEAHETEEVLHQLIPNSRITEFEDRHEADFAYAVPGPGPISSQRVQAARDDLAGSPGRAELGADGGRAGPPRGDHQAR